MKVIDRHKFSEVRMKEDAQLLIGKRMEWSQDGERFTLDDHKRGIGISYSKHDLKCFRKGVYHENARLLQAIQSLLELVDEMGAALEGVCSCRMHPESKTDWCPACEALVSKDEVLKGLAL